MEMQSPSDMTSSEKPGNKRCLEFGKSTLPHSKKSKNSDTLAPSLFHKIFQRTKSGFPNAISHEDTVTMAAYQEKYSFVKWIYVSTASLVAEVVDMENGESRAMKISFEQDCFNKEKHALETLQGQHHIVKLLDSFSLSGLSCYGLVLPLYQSEEFVPVSVPELVSFMQQVLQALRHCHASGFVHRDVKPGNILWIRDSGGLQIALADFGFALNCNESDEILKSDDEHVGTVPYMAPEILSMMPYHHYPADIWSAGIVFTELMCVQPIFPAETEKELRGLVEKYRLHPELCFPPVHPRFAEIWPVAKPLLLQMLDCNKSTRITADEALCSQFFQGFKNAH